jgi:hypothetical protein
MTRSIPMPARIAAADLGREELAHLPVARGEQLVRATHVLNIDGRPCARTRDPRLQDGHAFRFAVRADNDDDASSRRPLDLAHEAAAEPALTCGAAHPLKAIDLDQTPLHGEGTGRRNASGVAYSPTSSRSRAASRGAYARTSLLKYASTSRPSARQARMRSAHSRKRSSS